MLEISTQERINRAKEDMSILLKQLIAIISALGCEKFARLIGYNKAYINRIQRYKTDPTAEQVINLLERYQNAMK